MGVVRMKFVAPMAMRRARGRIAAFIEERVYSQWLGSCMVVLLLRMGRVLGEDKNVVPMVYGSSVF